MKKVFFKLLLFFPLLIIVSAVNFFNDPAHLFKGTHYEKDIADLLNQGKNVAIFGDVDNMLLQKYYIENINTRITVVAIGSSRLFQLDSEFFPNQTFFNNSMASLSSVDDEMLIYWFYKKRGLTPSKIILGLDPWLINKSTQKQPYQSLPRDYLEMAKFAHINLSISEKFVLFINSFNKFFQLLSPSYFQSSLQTLFKKDNKFLNKDYFATDQKFGDLNIKLSDGSLSYNKSVRERTVNEINLAASNYIIKENDTINQNAKNKFEKFINILKDDGVDVTLALIPYHPKTFDQITLQKHLSILTTATNYFHTLAQDKNVRIIGSFNPEDFKLTDEDFYDGVHIKKKALRKIFE